MARSSRLLLSPAAAATAAAATSTTTTRTAATATRTTATRTATATTARATRAAGRTAAAVVAAAHDRPQLLREDIADLVVRVTQQTVQRDRRHRPEGECVRRRVATPRLRHPRDGP